jgi:hypothetical protein
MGALSRATLVVTDSPDFGKIHANEPLEEAAAEASPSDGSAGYFPRREVEDA